MVCFCEEDGKEGMGFSVASSILYAKQTKIAFCLCLRVTLIPDLIVLNPFVLEQGVSSKCQQSSQREGQECRMIKDWNIGRWMD
jgi:hypothetical protein